MTSFGNPIKNLLRLETKSKDTTPKKQRPRISPPVGEKYIHEPRSTPKNEIFPFLLLPLEVRTLVYEYLVPNLDAYAWYRKCRNCPICAMHHGGYSPRPRYARCIYLRNDDVRPSLALLQTCTKVYSEFVEQFYGHARFSILVRPNEIKFFEQTIAENAFEFRFIKHLKVTMNVPGPYDDDDDEKTTPGSHPKTVTRLLNLLENSPLIKSLHLQLKLPRDFVMMTCLLAMNHKRSSPLFRAIMKPYFREIASRVCPVLELKGIEKTMSVREPYWDTYISKAGSPRRFGFETRGFVAGLLEKFGSSEGFVAGSESSIVWDGKAKEVWEMGYEAATEMKLDMGHGP